MSASYPLLADSFSLYWPIPLISLTYTNGWKLGAEFGDGDKISRTNFSNALFYEKCPF